MTHRPILYVEDEEDYQILVRRILGHAGLDVVIAETGQGGLEALRRQRPSLFLLDINLPDMDGYTLCQELRQDPAWTDLPILMLTVRRRPQEWLQGFSCGANDYLSKPINPPELIERVLRCLKKKVPPFTGNGTPEYNLIRAAVAGNRAAYEVLVQKYRARLVNRLQQTVQNLALVEDLVSQAFALAFEKLDRFRGEASFYTWVYRIAINEWSSTHRQRGAVSLEELLCGDESALPSALAKPDDLDDAMDAQESRSTAHAMEALSQVPQPYRKMLELFCLRDMPYDAIAKKLDIPEGTVMSRLFKARHLLLDAWQGVGTK
jgi:RNA polymerase sigma factor (sigma-70 family)